MSQNLIWEQYKFKNRNLKFDVISESQHEPVGFQERSLKTITKTDVREN